MIQSAFSVLRDHAGRSMCCQQKNSQAMYISFAGGCVPQKQLTCTILTNAHAAEEWLDNQAQCKDHTHTQTVRWHYRALTQAEQLH